MIKRLLIANRGEIARRIIRTCRKLGVETVAVFSDADVDAPHVGEADRSVRLGPAPARESYLRADLVIAAAKESGADAIHPGYGFLSENADFAEAVVAAGLVWVGPPASSIRAMGLKDAAKSLMAAAGVPVTPGYLGEDQAPERLQSEADRIGYPVLIKAVAGGGGKGMRRVDEAAAFSEALGAAKREAAAAFGDDRVLLETYVTRPRHIEVQVFADNHGNVVHLFERDCSLQRRHQKVIEEAPAPGMSPEARQAVTSAAVKAAQAVGYQGAGTVEFIADASEGLRGDRIFFMEMNTRLQVEHPVTEMITGVDLVEWQLRVASGEPLPLRQDQLSITGHAVEARLYAENPATGFLPSTGRLDHFRFPEPRIEHLSRSREREGPAPEEAWEGEGLPDRRLSAEASRGEPRTPHPPTGSAGGPLPLPSGEVSIRIDSAVEQGGEVSVFYDPMIAKLIAWAPTREAAAAALAEACKSVEVWPVRTNAGFLARCLDHPDFLAGEVDTGFIPGRLEAVIRKPVAPGLLVSSAMSVLADEKAHEADGRAYAGKLSDDPWLASASGAYGFRLNAPARARMRISSDTADLSAEVTPEPIGLGGRRSSSWTVIYDEECFRLEPGFGGDTPKYVHTDRTAEPLAYLREDHGCVFFADGEAYAFSEPNYAQADAGAESDGAVLAPMPGRIVSVDAAAGQTVTKGAKLVTLEAMKMEHGLTAPFDGVVAEVHATAGGQVSEGAVLVRIEAS